MICGQNLQPSKHQIAELMNIEPDDKFPHPLKPCSKQDGGRPTVTEDAGHPQQAQGKAVFDEICHLGAKFSIIYMLWMGNIPAAFQMELTPTYKPMDQFQNRLEGKRQGEQADLRKVFPKKFHSEFHGNLHYHHVGTFLSFICFCSHTHLSSKKA